LAPDPHAEEEGKEEEEREGRGGIMILSTTTV